jgi:Arc/MetJ-type ribon-helix-helix transcriptional regulator
MLQRSFASTGSRGYTTLASDLGLAVPRSLLRRGACGYTSGMKTAVSIPDELFRKADELASRMGKSRSEVYRDALADYVSRRDPGAVTRALDEIVGEISAEERAFARAAARRTLAQSEW